MALSQAGQLALATLFFGGLAFLLAVVAENKKPPYGEAIPGKDVTICKYPSDPSVALGALSSIALLITTGLGVLCVFFPYKGRSLPKSVFFRSTALVVFFTLALGMAVLGEGMVLWATISEALLRVHNVYPGTVESCTTAKTGAFGGAAFLSLDAGLFFLVCQMYTLNGREDFMDEDDEEHRKGEYGEVLTVDYDGQKRSPAV